jgi:glutamate formiminotransferase/formiminotetrahydrofolate cyclodeaminase
MQSSLSDGAVGALCVTAAMEGAFLNVKINAQGLKDKSTADKLVERGASLLSQAKIRQQAIMDLVYSKM